MYRLTDTVLIERIADGARIPPDPENMDYVTFLAWQAGGGIPAPYVPPPPPVPVEVPRWAGRLALKRHVLDGGELIALAADEVRNDNLLASVLAWRQALPEGELADRVDAALHDAKDWLRGSETVGVLAAVLGLTDGHVDRLFLWADQQEM